MHSFVTCQSFVNYYNKCFNAFLTFKSPMQLAQCLITSEKRHITFAGHWKRAGMPHCHVIDKVTTFYKPNTGTYCLPHTGWTVTTAEHWGQHVKSDSIELQISLSKSQYTKGRGGWEIDYEYKFDGEGYLCISFSVVPTPLAYQVFAEYLQGLKMYLLLQKICQNSDRNLKFGGQAFKEFARK